MDIFVKDEITIKIENRNLNTINQKEINQTTLIENFEHYNINSQVMKMSQNNT